MSTVLATIALGSPGGVGSILTKWTPHTGTTTKLSVALRVRAPDLTTEWTWSVTRNLLFRTLARLKAPMALLTKAMTRRVRGAGASTLDS